MIHDDSPMPFGKYQGMEMIDVPDSYLLYIYNNFENLSDDLREYIEDNLDAIKLNARN